MHILCTDQKRKKRSSKFCYICAWFFLVSPYFFVIVGNNNFYFLLNYTICAISWCVHLLLLQHTQNHSLCLSKLVEWLCVDNGSDQSSVSPTPSSSHWRFTCKNPFPMGLNAWTNQLFAHTLPYLMLYVSRTLLLLPRQLQYPSISLQYLKSLCQVVCTVRHADRVVQLGVSRRSCLESAHSNELSTVELSVKDETDDKGRSMITADWGFM